MPPEWDMVYMVTMGDTTLHCVMMEAGQPAVMELPRSMMATCPALLALTTRDQAPALTGALPPGDLDQDQDHGEGGSPSMEEGHWENKAFDIHDLIR